MELVIKLQRGKYHWAVNGPRSETRMGTKEDLVSAYQACSDAWHRFLRESVVGADLEEHATKVIVMDNGNWEDLKVFRDVGAFREYAQLHTKWDTDADEFHHSLEALRAGETVVTGETVIFWTDLVEDGEH